MLNKNQTKFIFIEECPINADKRIFLFEELVSKHQMKGNK